MTAVHETQADAPPRLDRRQVSVEQYVSYRRDGFVIVRGLLPPENVAELRQHTDDMLQGRLPEQRAMEESTGRDGPGASQSHDRDKRPGATQTGRRLIRPPERLSPEEKAQHFLRIHMLHRKLELHERYLLHPRVLDVLEVLTGPDVLCLQSMLFLKPPGKPGQGWHQDTYFIPTHPDSLCAAWIAIDDADERNGAMWFAKGSGNEPVYPPCPNGKKNFNYGFGNKLVSDITYVKGVSKPDDSENDLTKVAERYDQVLASAKAGDVVFFNGHVLHRSRQNWTSDRCRRAFVGHYCNARSFTQWGADLPDAKGNVFGTRAREDQAVAAPDKLDPATRMTNGSHILARGDTHLPFAQPRFGTPCAATQPAKERRREREYAARIIADMNHGLMGCGIADPDVPHDHDDGGL